MHYVIRVRAFNVVTGTMEYRYARDASGYVYQSLDAEDLVAEARRCGGEVVRLDGVKKIDFYLEKQRRNNA